MMKIIDGFLNKITMYKAVLYCLIFLWLAALALSSLGLLPYSPADLVISLVFVLAVCYFSNFIFAWAFEAPSNADSVYITAFILALIISPARPAGNLLFLGFASLAAMASKYILAINKKHVFNPAAIAVVATALAFNMPAVWWIGTPVMIPFVLAAGFLIVRKIKRFDLVYSFLSVALAANVIFSLADGQNAATALRNMLFYSPLFFFASVMLTEPMTSPPFKKMRMFFGAFVGFMFAPQVHLGSFYFTPELALVCGNIFAYLVSPKRKLILALKKKIRLSPDVYEFLFSKDKRFAFAPGQYLEWTLDHEKADSRGIRRVFTIASSPREEGIKIGVKFYNPSSSFKRSLLAVPEGGTVIASQLSGDFVLPRNKNKKLAFIAGGIGITPFRSMIKHLLDTNQQRSITLLYLNKTEQDIVYKNVLEEARQKLGIKTVYALTGPGEISRSWKGRRGFLDERAIREEIPDYRARTFYISGPPAMVAGFENILEKMGISKNQIKKDFFSGF